MFEFEDRQPGPTNQFNGLDERPGSSPPTWLVHPSPKKLSVQAGLSVVADDAAAGDGLHDAIEIEAAGLLAWWKFPEALHPLPYVGRRRSNHEDMVR
jgi:hypothetical protein